MRYTFEFSREESYLHLLEHLPEFIERVPGYMIASYFNAWNRIGVATEMEDECALSIE